MFYTGPQLTHWGAFKDGVLIDKDVSLKELVKRVDRKDVVVGRVPSV